MQNDKHNQESAIVPRVLDSGSIQDFLRQPLAIIAAGVTGALASGRSDFFLAGGRVLQAALKGHLYEQVGREINEFVDKGKLKQDYGETPLGFKSLQELIEFIDSDAPDEDRLRGVQAMFYAVNAVGTVEAERILMYELFRLSKRLSGSQIRLLSVAYGARSDNLFSSTSAVNLSEWLHLMAEKAGHGLSALVELDELVLTEYKLLSERLAPDKLRVHSKNARLTDLGMKLCEALKNYDEVKEQISNSRTSS